MYPAAACSRRYVSLQLPFALRELISTAADVIWMPVCHWRIHGYPVFLNTLPRVGPCQPGQGTFERGSPNNTNRGEQPTCFVLRSMVSLLGVG